MKYEKGDRPTGSNAPLSSVESNSPDWITFETLMREFTVLKAEQTVRIGFRDNLLYVTLLAIGAVGAFAYGKDATPNALYCLLGIPWIAIILGWTYIANDQHISRLGTYVREELAVQMRSHYPCLPAGIFGWESYHRIDGSRSIRKIFQLLVDLITFVFSGLVALGLFVDSRTKSFSSLESLSRFEWTLVVLEIMALFALAAWISGYSDTDAEIAKRRIVAPIT